jgi:hypothetical protein
VASHREAIDDPILEMWGILIAASASLVTSVLLTNRVSYAPRLSRLRRVKCAFGR